MARDTDARSDWRPCFLGGGFGALTKQRKTKIARRSSSAQSSKAGVRRVSSAVAKPYNATTTRERIVEAAKKHFSEVGLQNASIRAITQIAKVNSALIRYHFGSKQALYEEVVRRIARRLVSVRGEALQQLRTTHAGESIPLERLLRTYIEPLLIRESDDISRDAAIYMRFFGRMYTEPSDELRTIMQSQFTTLQTEYIDEIMRSTPHVSREEVIFRFGLLIGAITFVGSRLGIVEILSSGRVNDLNPEHSLSLIVSAYTALFSAPSTPLNAGAVRLDARSTNRLVGGTVS